MNRTNIDWITLLITLFVIVFLVGPLLNLIGAFVSIAPVSIAVAALGAVWLIGAGLAPLRGGTRRGNTLGSAKVTYWRGQRIETRQSARQRLRSNMSGVSLLVSLWLLALGVGSAYAAVVMLGRLVGVL